MGAAPERQNGVRAWFEQDGAGHTTRSQQAHDYSYSNTDPLSDLSLIRNEPAWGIKPKLSPKGVPWLKSAPYFLYAIRVKRFTQLGFMGMVVHYEIVCHSLFTHSKGGVCLRLLLPGSVHYV